MSKELCDLDERVHFQGKEMKLVEAMSRASEQGISLLTRRKHAPVVYVGTAESVDSLRLCGVGDVTQVMPVNGREWEDLYDLRKG